MRAATLPLTPPFSAIWYASPFVHCALIEPVAVSGDASTPAAGNATFVALMKQSFTTVAFAAYENVPADARIADTSLDVVPQARSGVLARFPVTRYRAATIALRTPDGAPLPPGLQAVHVESGQRTIVGYDGLTFVDGLAADNHLEIDGDGRRCSVEFAYQGPDDGTLPRIGPLTCALR